VLHIEGALSPRACASLRDAVDTLGVVTIDSVDALPNRDLAMPIGRLEELIGPEEARSLLHLPSRFRERARACARAEGHGGHDGDGAAAPAEARAAAPAATRAAAPAASGAMRAGSAPGISLAGSFARRYVADASGHEQPLTSFHFDSAALTVNVALSADADVDGGRLLGVYDNAVHCIDRRAGDATVHSSSLLHGVTCMRGKGIRYSLILFFTCPDLH